LSSDGNVVAIGAVGNDGNGTDSGHVRVYEWNAGTWQQKGSDINGEAVNDQSGKSVSLSSDGNIVANGSDSGHVRVYKWNAGTSDWAKLGDDIDGEAEGDWSGYSVSLSGNGTVVAIGAPNNGDNGSLSGHVRVYEWNDSTSSWMQKGADIDGEAAGDGSGRSVSLSGDGNVVAIGAPENDGNGSRSGHVRVYEF
jgi:hypothetical protein